MNRSDYRIVEEYGQFWPQKRRYGKKYWLFGPVVEIWEPIQGYWASGYSGGSYDMSFYDLEHAKEFLEEEIKDDEAYEKPQVIHKI